MTHQPGREAQVVIDDLNLAALVRDAVDSMSTEKATAFAIGVGVRPPTDEPGWELVVEFDDPGVLLWELVAEDDTTP